MVNLIIGYLGLILCLVVCRVTENYYQSNR